MKPIAKHSLLLKILICVELFVGLTAIIGGIQLLIANKTGMTLFWMKYIPAFHFDSYLIPGIVLITVVGGVNILASIFLWKKREYSLELSAVAGFDLQIWIFTQVYILKKVSWLQAFYFALATFILLLTFWIEGLIKKRKNRSRI